MITTTEEIRDAQGRITGYTITVIDDHGRKFTTSYNTADIVGAQHTDIVSELTKQVVAQIVAKTAAPGVVTVAPIAVVVATVKASPLVKK